MRRLIQKKFEERRERRKLSWFLKELDRDLHVKVRRLKKHERIEVLRYIVVAKLKDKLLELEHRFERKKNDLKKSHSGIDYLEHKIQKIPSRIRLFEVDYLEEEFKKICRLLISIEKEVDNV